eukprot:g27948.t1
MNYLSAILNDDTPAQAPEPFEPPPPLPFPAERVSAAPHLVSQPPPAPDFLSKPLVNISFGGGPPESWGSSTETRRPADVLQDYSVSYMRSHETADAAFSREAAVAAEPPASAATASAIAATGKPRKEARNAASFAALLVRAAPG